MTAWAIAYKGEILVSTIRIRRKFAIEDYVEDVDMHGCDWYQCMRDGCRCIKVKVEVL